MTLTDRLAGVHGFLAVRVAAGTNDRRRSRGLRQGEFEKLPKPPCFGGFRLVVSRQYDAERRALIQLAFHGDCAFDLFQMLFYDAQSQTDAAARMGGRGFVSLHEGFEDTS